jgi:hypothetical protein
MLRPGEGTPEDFARYAEIGTPLPWRVANLDDDYRMSSVLIVSERTPHSLNLLRDADQEDIVAVLALQVAPKDWKLGYKDEAEYDAEMITIAVNNFQPLLDRLKRIEQAAALNGWELPD